MIRGIEILDEGPPGGRSPQSVLFLHGLGATAEGWRAQLDGLSPMMRCVAWTMPGYLRSRPVRGELTIAALADAAAELLEGLELPRVAVVGHSMGGFVAQELALRHPDRVDRLVLVSTAPAFGGADGPEGLPAAEFLAARMEPVNEGRRMQYIARQVVPTMVAPNCPLTVQEAAMKLMGALSPASYRAALEAVVRFDARSRLPELSLPTLCVTGRADTATPPADAERLAGLIPDARLELIDGAGHLLPMERPDDLNRLIRSFLVWM
ncbi:MAG: alpha/beta fold hydrolase [Acidimicrobiales bacterium]